jgi:uncharacterized protein (TIGR02284 family)
MQTRVDKETSVTDQDVLTRLAQLLGSSEDGEKGFAKAARDATDSELKSFLRRRAEDCRTIAIELNALLQSLGGAPEGSGAIHRGWPNGATTFGRSDLTVLADVELAECTAEEAYFEALTTVLPDRIRNMLERQHVSAVHNRDHIRELRHSYRTMSDTYPQTANGS